MPFVFGYFFDRNKNELEIWLLWNLWRFFFSQIGFVCSNMKIWLFIPSFQFSATLNCCIILYESRDLPARLAFLRHLWTPQAIRLSIVSLLLGCWQCCKAKELIRMDAGKGSCTTTWFRSDLANFTAAERGAKRPHQDLVCEVYSPAQCCSGIALCPMMYWFDWRMASPLQAEDLLNWRTDF